jgi:hypothetical protein
MRGRLIWDVECLSEGFYRRRWLSARELERALATVSEGLFGRKLISKKYTREDGDDACEQKT